VSTSHSLPDGFAKEVAELHAMYPRLAARVTHLRTILNEFEETPPSTASLDLWVADVQSVTTDFLTLIGNTRSLLRKGLDHYEATK
jgi:hypothetical protein